MSLAPPGQVGIVDLPAPDPARKGLHQLVGGTLQDDLAGVDDRHPGTQVRDIVDDVGRQDHDDVLADFRQQVVEPVALLGVEARGGFIDDHEARRADEGLGDPKPLSHAARVAGHGTLANLPEVHLVEEPLDHLPPLTPLAHALEHRKVVEEVQRRHPGIDPEVLRQVAQCRSEHLRLGQHVDVPEPDAPRGGRLQRRHTAHQGRLPRSVRTEQTEHAGRGLETRLGQGPNPGRVHVGDAVEDQRRWGRGG